MGAAVVLGVGLTWPSAIDRAVLPTSTFTGGHVAALAVATRTWAPHTVLSGWPLGVDFRPMLWPSIVLAHVVGAPAAYALTLVLTPAANVLGGWVLGRVLFGEARAALCLGALLAAPPWVRTTLQNGQPEQALLGIGAASFALMVWAAEGARWRLALVAPVVALAGITAPHVILATLGVVAVWAVAGVRAAPRRAAALGLALVGALGVAAWHAPGFDASIDHFFAPFGLLDASAGPAPKRAVLASDLFFAARMPPGKGPGVIHLGYVGLPLALGAAWAGWRTPGAPRWALFAAAGLLVLAFGEAGPFRWVAALSATLAASGTPYRFVLGVVLALSLVVARSRVAPWVAALSLAEAAWVDPRPLPFPTEAWAQHPTAPIPAGQSPLLDLPVVSRSCREAAAHYLAEAGTHGRPTPLYLRSGPLAWGADDTTPARIAAALGAADCAERLPAAVAGFGVVVAHTHGPCRVRPSELRCLTDALGPPAPGEGVRVWTVAAGE